MGIEKYPKEARFYRHRGHRYISSRQYDKAITDYEKAVTLIEGKEDQVEKDGLPNSKNLPLSTLHGNIWYHLGLAYYLNNDMENSLKAYSNRIVTQKYDDNIVSGGHWLYMINRRLGNKMEADSVVSGVTAGMDIIENMAYHQMCLFYNGTLTSGELIKTIDDIEDPILYGLANWHLYDQQDTVTAKKYYYKLLKEGSPFSFAYLAAEADWDTLLK
jgi:tetratricopeptide (TPR) repeat protein